MSALVFVDSNVLVYGRDAAAPQKQARAKAWLAFLWAHRLGRLSFQVLEEFYATVTGKLRPGLGPELARKEVRFFLSWHPVAIDARVLEGAWGLQDRYRLSGWDALIIAAARVSDCGSLLTEDLQDGQRFGTLRVVNPFLHPPESVAHGRT